ncbi:TIR domain-containing protein [Myxococcus fulvus]|uniref:TIR domain-containing protein n=1 Tax=Myxococcus fulvus TaxID=33 RepID=A0A511TB69_MYXFU|nr:toll/interleukin-1 receptor domain-containing protein [Myxococcus fulvus]GEN11424.1 hypothetical protein MFU01_64610 [Myxococcus fulvus]SEU13716.1 TIR domain-containing protein [Myxococcus fulvus]
MTRPRIFISHSGTEPSAVQLRKTLAQRLRDDGYRVLVDEDELKIGEHWRPTINAWIGGCDAAVLLVSSAALESKFVAYETSLLSYRHGSEQGRFMLIPVFLPPVTMQDVNNSPLEPARIADRQAIYGNLTQEQIIERVLQNLKDHEPNTSFSERHAKRLGGLLEKVDTVDLETVAGKVGTALAPWTPGVHLPMRVALGLMAAGLDGATAGVRVFRSRLQGTSSVEVVMTLIATSFVDCRSVAEIGKVGKQPGQPFLLALNGSNSRTAGLYVVSGCDHLPVNDSWRVVQADGVMGSAGLEDLKSLVRSVLAHRFNVPPEEVDETVRSITDEGEPVFVALSLSAEAVTTDMLDALRSEFPTLSLFLMTGRESLSEELARQAGITLLHPPLEPDIEQPFWVLYDKKLKYLKIP